MIETPSFPWPPGYRAAAAFTFDVDAESAILSTAPEAAARLSVMTHQAYGPRTGVPRLLRMLDRQAIRATFFIPGYTAERWPAVVRSIRDAGHEIGHHGYLHEQVSLLPPSEEERLLLRGLAALDAVAGVRPIGWRAPVWEASNASAGILARHGFRYDSSLMDADHPYRLAAGPEPGAPSIIELPIHWGLDDWEQYVYLPDLSGSGLIESPTKVFESWTLELEALVDEGGVFILTNHPFASGRPSRAVALERLIERARSIDGLWIATLAEIAAHAETLPLEPVVHVPPGTMDA